MKQFSKMIVYYFMVISNMGACMTLTVSRIIIIVWQQITGWLEVSIISYVICDKITKTTSSLEKQARHINEHPKNTLG